MKRSLDDRGVYFTFDASPNNAAATERQTSTSKPLQPPLASGLENPGTPWLTPHWIKPLALTRSNMGPALAGVTIAVVVIAAAITAANVVIIFFIIHYFLLLIIHYIII